MKSICNPQDFFALNDFECIFLCTKLWSFLSMEFQMKPWNYFEFIKMEVWDKALYYSELGLHKI